MPRLVEVEGAEQLAALSKALRTMGDKDLQRELYAGINRGTKPLKVKLRASLERHLPKHGGLAAAKARSLKLRTSRRTGARIAGIRVTAAGGQATRMDTGSFRHPVFGRAPWQTQRITPGWFTGPTEASAPVVRAEIEKSMADVVAALNRKVH